MIPPNGIRHERLTDEDIYKKAGEEIGGYIEPVRLNQKPLGPEDSREPWKLEGFEAGDPDENPTAYGRQNRGNWCKETYALCDEDGLLKKLPKNKALPWLCGTVVIFTVLTEYGSMDTAPCEVDESVLRELGVLSM